MIKPICPRCQVPLSRKNNKGVFRYSCSECLGFAVHFGGLIKVIDPRAVKEIWETARRAESGETTCSHCRKAMKVVYASPSSVELDVCTRCNLTWLDTGEWEDLDKTPRNPRLSQNENLEYGRILLKLDEDKRKSQDTGVIQVGIGDVSSWKLAVAVLGIPVERDDDGHLATPWLTWSLVITCVFVSILCFQNMDWALENLAYRADRPFGSGFLTMITSFFVHGGWLHLIGNLYFLWIFGDNVEDHLGKARFVSLVFLATVAGDLTFRWLHPSVVPLVGASGGISGVISYYIVRFPHRKFVFFFWLRWFSIPAFVLGGLFFLKDALGAMVEISNSGGGVAHLAHLGGAAIGVAFAVFYSPQRKLQQIQ